MLKQRAELLDKFLEVANSYVGYKARPGGQSGFGEMVGYNSHGTPWTGAFIDVVAREAGVLLPACVYTPSGLAEFVHTRRFKTRPRPGDIVFFSSETDQDFGMPSAGIVTDITNVRETDRFKCIQAQTHPGLPKSSKDRDGVYIRERWLGDTIGFGRPDFKARPGGDLNNATDRLSIDPNSVRPGRKNQYIATVQIALWVIVDLKISEPGKFDERTREAFARYQRRIGIVGSAATGIPDAGQLGRLGRESKMFEVSVGSS